jgi:hypothetical protein
MNQHIGLIVGARATSELAISALPCAPVRPGPHRRHQRIARRLLSVLSEQRR